MKKNIEANINFRVTKKERDEWKSHAIKNGLTLSDFIRKTINKEVENGKTK